MKHKVLRKLSEDERKLIWQVMHSNNAIIYNKMLEKKQTGALTLQLYLGSLNFHQESTGLIDPTFFWRKLDWTNFLPLSKVKYSELTGHFMKEWPNFML